MKFRKVMRYILFKLLFTVLLLLASLLVSPRTIKPYTSFSCVIPGFVCNAFFQEFLCKRYIVSTSIL